MKDSFGCEVESGATGEDYKEFERCARDIKRDREKERERGGGGGVKDGMEGGVWAWEGRRKYGRQVQA